MDDNYSNVINLKYTEYKILLYKTLYFIFLELWTGPMVLDEEMHRLLHKRF